MDNQLSLGGFVFNVSTAEYDKLKRSYQYRWQRHDRLNRKPAYQFQGAGETTITLSGTIHIYNESDIEIPAQMKAEADSGKALELLAGFSGNQATYEGKWIVPNLEFDESDILANGIGQTINFTITIKEYGEDA